MRIVDLRSDTLTKPTQKMREAMMAAAVGDDVFGEDPTINRLQERMGEMTGKEAALFVTSGTQGNQVAINAHTRPGQEIIVDKNSHIVNYESGAPAMLSGVQIHALDGTHGVITVEQIEAAIRPEDDHYPQSGLICLENTHNRAGGTIYPIAEIRRISEFAKKRNIPLHLDGARLWNASVATGVSLKEYCQYVDSAMIAFSKGLGAPVGSIVVGSKDFIKRAHFYRKAYGGGIRQGGMLAAAAIYGIDHHLPLLKEDHRRARRFAEAVSEIPGLSIGLNTVQTNIVIFNIDSRKMSAAQLVQKFSEKGVLTFAFGPTRVRAVFHLEISDEDLDFAIQQLTKIIS